MVAPVGSDKRCCIRLFLKSFGAIMNIYKANNRRSVEDREDPRNPCDILRENKHRFHVRNSFKLD